jgi:internalin A
MLFIGEWTEQVMWEDVMLLVQQLQQLDALHVFGVDVSTLPQHAACLHGLEHLSLEDCDGVDEKGVVKSLAALTSLRSLSVHGCSMWKLPGAFPALQRLQSLDLRGRGVDKDVVEAVCSISSLEVLDLSRSPSLHSLPDSISCLTGLYSLSLWESQVTRLPDSMTAMSRIRELAWGGPPAEEAGDWLQLDVVWRLTGLDTLALSDALARSLGNSLGQLTGLSALMVEGEALAALPDGLSRLVGLERLTINAGKLKALPAGVTALTQLTELVLNCPLLQRMEPAVQAFVAGCSSKKENTSSG